jgi:glycosyltransferase involved in cell wall biosynthesis
MTPSEDENPVRSASRISVCLLCDTVGLDAGTERLVVEIARRLDSAQFDVHVCCLEDSRQLRSLEGVCRTAVFPLVSVHSPRGIRQLASLRSYLDRHNIQIVHGFTTKTNILAVLSSIASRRIVITSRLNTGYWYTPIWKLVFRILNRGTTRVLTNSEAGRSIVAKAERLDPQRIDVVYQGVNAERFQPGVGDAAAGNRLGIPESATVIGIVANLRPVKDLPLFLRAAKIVSERCPQAAFLVVGHGEQLGELQALAEELGIHDRVFFTRGEGRVIDYLARMSVACLSSESEGFSNAILEYMACGLPVVATDVGGNRELVVDGETGFVVRDRTPEAFARPLVELLENEKLRQRMSASGLARCLSNFETSKTIRDLENYYSGLIRRASSS